MPLSGTCAGRILVARVLLVPLHLYGTRIIEYCTVDWRAIQIADDEIGH